MGLAVGFGIRVWQWGRTDTVSRVQAEGIEVY